MPHVGDHVVVLDPHLARWLAEPTGTIMEVRCDGGHVKVEHDGSLSADLGVPKMRSDSLADVVRAVEIENFEGH